MSKLSNALWTIALLFIVFTYQQDGFSTTLMIIAGLAVFVLIMQIWLQSKTRKRLHDKEKDDE